VIYVLRQWKNGNITGIKWHLERNKVPYQIIEAYECPQYPELKKGDAVIGLGGPPSVCNMHDKDYEHEFILYEAGFLGYAVLEEIPFFGICLSHQLRAKMYNNPVETKTLEFGIQEVELNQDGRSHWLFEGMPETVRFYQHHRDHVLKVNSGAVLLGNSPNCPVEAVAWDDYGVSTQFHPEVLAADIPDALAKYPQSLEATGMTLDQMMARLPDDYMPYVTRMFDNFLRRAGAIR
jgi:GMP synthase-like glutamine amidotransferase